MNSDVSTDQSESHGQLPVSVVAMQPTTRRVVLTMGGKGGVGKTSFMLALAEWFVGKEVTLKLLDLDTENKTRGSLSHYFGRATKKVNIHMNRDLRRSVLSWAAHLQNRVQYIVVENAITYPADFTYWRETEQAQVFQKAMHPVARKRP